MKNIIVLIIGALALMTMFSSCASQYHTTSDGYTYKKTSKSNHWQYKNGKVTKQTGKTSCAGAW
tara:strand:+ start:192 stop:383 length:192 start_codon:yes stop_codon:yes gene_type:complete